MSQKSKWWKWVFGGVRPENYPTLVSVSPQRLINQAREEQRKQAMAVAIATAAAAQAAMAAAKAAAEVVQLTGIPRSFQEYEKRIRNSAAIKIQAAYRAHLVSFSQFLARLWLYIFLPHHTDSSTSAHCYKFMFGGCFRKQVFLKHFTGKSVRYGFQHLSSEP